MSDASKLGLGHIITTPQQRDAIHVAVAPVVAEHQLRAGQHVGLLASGTAYPAPANNAVGIVDPFLTSDVKAGQTFWLFLYPGTITSLRHDWTHPAFLRAQPDIVQSDDKTYSERWLRDYAAKVNTYYDRDKAFLVFMEDVRQGDIFFHGTDCHGPYEVDDIDELFKHLSIYLSREVRKESMNYTCSC